MSDNRKPPQKGTLFPGEEPEKTFTESEAIRLVVTALGIGLFLGMLIAHFVLK